LGAAQPAGRRTVKPADFRRWRKSLDLSQKSAAEALGLKRRVLQYYERGERDGKKVKVPKAVRLACYALALGVKDYKGPAKSRKAVPAGKAEAAAPDSAPLPRKAPPAVTPTD